MACFISIEGPFKNICTFISMICLIYQVSKEGEGGGDFRENLIIGGRENYAYVGECVLTIFLSPQVPMKSFWNHLLIRTVRVTV